MSRMVFWPDAEMHFRPTEKVSDGEGGMRSEPLHWPSACVAARRALEALPRLPFVTRVVLDTREPFEVVCAIPKASDHFDADVVRVEALLQDVLRGEV